VALNCKITRTEYDKAVAEYHIIAVDLKTMVLEERGGGGLTMSCPATDTDRDVAITNVNAIASTNQSAKN
jgi:hypothetical protein